MKVIASIALGPGLSLPAVPPSPERSVSANTNDRSTS
jgi:hypothetical protein